MRRYNTVSDGVLFSLLLKPLYTIEQYHRICLFVPLSLRLLEQHQPQATLHLSVYGYGGQGWNVELMQVLFITAEFVANG